MRSAESELRKHVKSGSPLSARFTLPDEPRNLYCSTPRTRSSGNCARSTSSRNVRRGSRPDTTTGALISSPFARTTPVVRPSFTSTRVTAASVRISAPNERAALAIDSLIAPVPPFWNPQARNAPSISPM